MTYKGFEIVAQFTRYELWDVNEDGNGFPFHSMRLEYDAELDGYQIWDGDNDWQHEDFTETFDMLREAKAAIDSHLALKMEAV